MNLTLNITFPDVTSISDFIAFWDSATFGLFSTLIPLLVIFSVALKTRSVSLTTVVTILVFAVTGEKWLVSIAALGLAVLLFRAWRESSS